MIAGHGYLNVFGVHHVLEILHKKDGDLSAAIVLVTLPLTWRLRPILRQIAS